MSIPEAADIRDFLEGYGITENVISDTWINKRINNFIIPTIERRIGYSIKTSGNATEYLSGTGTNILILSRRPINSLVSLGYVSSSDVIYNITQTVELDSEQGIIIAKTNPPEGGSNAIFRKGENNIKIVYNVGFDDLVNPKDDIEKVDLKDAIIMLCAREILIQIGARTGGGSLSVQAFNRNFGNRGKYSDLINQIDANVYTIIKSYISSVVGA